MDDTDLRGLDPDSAKEYILSFATEAKRYERDIDAAMSELTLWNSRVALAESKGAAELAQAARAKAGELAAKLESLKAEKRSLDSKVEAMKGSLRGIKAAERSVDADRLLAEMQLATGEALEPEAAATDAAFAKLEKASGVESELEALKRKMGQS